MSKPDRKVVTLLPRPAFLLELHSERMIDALHALHDAGFTVTRVAGIHNRATDNRYRIDDTEAVRQ